jgi:outer membrane protein OmpA-like peptidoglycan-associated protein
MKKLSLLIVAMLCVVGLNAQQSKSDKSVEFRPHWDLQLQGGASYTIGETSSFGELVSPAVYLSTNYRFHHAMGIRIGVGGWQGKGAIVVPAEAYRFNFLQLNADYKLDLSSLIGGYDHRRPVSVYALAGVAFGSGLNNKALTKDGADLATSYRSQFDLIDKSRIYAGGRFGLGLDFRVSDLVTLNLEGNANVLPDKFNYKKAENVDWQFNLLAGVSVSFGKKYQTSQAWVDEQATMKRIEEERIERERQAEEARVAEEAKKAEEARVAEAKKAEARRIAAVRAENISAHSENVFFAIGSSTIRKAEMEKIAKLAEWLKANADYTVDVVGYADKETGAPAGNLKLSERRAENVKKALVAAGVEESRIDSGYKGDTVQPFDKATENRVVICTLE